MMKRSLSRASATLFRSCYFAIATMLLFDSDTLIDAQNCPMTLWVFSNVNECYQSKPAESIGTIYADGNCHTLKKDKATNRTQQLFPGRYAAECTASGNLHFLHSGCRTGTCVSSSSVENAVCDTNFSATASLYVTNPTDRPVQDPSASFDGSYFCYFITGGANSELYVAFAVFGNCSVGCQVDGVAAPVALTSGPVAQPTFAPVDPPSPAPVRSPTDAPCATPLATPVPVSKAPSVALNSTNATATPSHEPTLAPVASSSSGPSLFRNSTTQGTASIPVNGTLTLSPPLSPDIRETIVDFPNNGALRVNAGGSITYTPTVNFVGIDTFRIEQCIDVTDSSNSEKCEDITVAVEVTAASNNNATPPPTEPASSSSSKGIYGLTALAVIPLAVVLYFMCGKKLYQRENDQTPNVQTKTLVDGESFGSGSPPPVTDVAWSVTVQPPAFGSNESDNYLPFNKDQVRDVIPPASDSRLDEISAITQSSTHPDNESFIRQPLSLEEPEVSNMLSKSYQRGSGRLHPLAAHLIEVRSNAAGGSPHEELGAPASLVVAEPQARVMTSVYGSAKRILHQPDENFSAEPVLVTAILISDLDDIADEQDAKEPTNRLDI